MRRYSDTTREVAQNGRRGALMISLNINHPDSLDFIKIKRDLTEVTGANISIQFTDEFMEAVLEDKEYVLRFPCHAKVIGDFSSLELGKLTQKGTDPKNNTKIWVRKVRAKEYWDEFIESSHKVAEPGELFLDTHYDRSPDTVYPEYKGVTTNPCGEIFMQPYDACRLLAVNLLGFVDNPYTEYALFNFPKFYKYSYEALRLGNAVIELEILRIDRIIDKIQKDPETTEAKRVELELWVNTKSVAASSRRTGIGFTALADTFAALGIEYGDWRSLDLTETLMNTKMRAELDCGVDLAIINGPFTGWDDKKEFTTLHYKGVEEVKGINRFYDNLNERFPAQVSRMRVHGRANVSWSTVAPTGSVSIMTQTTSGIEPLFQAYYTRRKKVNPGDSGVKINFIDDNGDSWQEFFVLHPQFERWLKLQGEEDIKDSKLSILESDDGSYPVEYLIDAFNKSPWNNSIANNVNWENRIALQGIIQDYTTHSISCTINLPEDVSLSAVDKIYMEAYKQGLKGVTIYRDGSRSGVLVSNSGKEDKLGFVARDSMKRPKELECNIHSCPSNPELLIIVGVLESKPYEVFYIQRQSEALPSTKATLVKRGSGEYDIESEGIIWEDITDSCKPELEVVTRLVSTSLRHNTDIKFIVEQLGKVHSGIGSFCATLSRVLKTYIPEGTKSTLKCSDCGSYSTVFEEGCFKCLDCGASRCG